MKTLFYRILTVITTILCLNIAKAQTSDSDNVEHEVVLTTDLGNIRIKLYNDTPLHRTTSYYTSNKATTTVYSFIALYQTLSFKAATRSAFTPYQGNYLVTATNPTKYLPRLSFLATFTKRVPLPPPANLMKSTPNALQVAINSISPWGRYTMMTISSKRKNI